MIDKYIKTDVEGLVKDPISGAVLNVDKSKLEAYKKQKQLALKASAANDRLDKVETDINDIKQMLQQLLKRH
jgi:hypothetical protein